MAAGLPAEACRVEGRLRGEGRQPEDAEEAVDSDHGMWLGDFARPGEARGADEIDPCWYGQEYLGC